MNRLSAEIVSRIQVGYNFLRDPEDRHPVLAPFVGGMAIGGVILGIDRLTDGALTSFGLDVVGMTPSQPDLSSIINGPVIG